MTNASNAASFAARIREELDVPVDLRKGRVGQFEVLVNGRSVVSRKGGLIARLVSRPWPSADDVVAAVRVALG